MAKLLKLRRGTTSQHSSFTGAEGEVTIDTDKDTAVVHDGSTAAGRPLAREDLNNVASASITSRLASGSIAGAKIANGAITSAHIAADTVVAADIAANAIGASELADNAVDTAAIASDAVTEAKIADGAVSTNQIANTAVSAAKLATNAVTEAKIATDAVTAGKIAANAVGSSEIAANAVGSSEIAANAVGSSEIAANAVGSSEIAANAVTSAKLNNGSVTNEKLDSIVQNRIKGRVSSGAGNVENLTAADVRTMINVENGATADQTAAEIRALVESASDSNVFTDADHGKLNGIESGATADQSASEILTLIKTVDGAGSGLDADTLDAISSGSFLRSDTADTASGDVTFSGGAGAINIAANSDIRFSNGSWSGNSASPKIQAHNDQLYICGGSGGIRFRENGTDRAEFNGNGHFIPTSNNTYDLGTSGNRWKVIYTNDLSMSNEGSANSVDGTWGDWTIQEGESDLFLLNNRSNKRYKFNLTEVK